MKDVISIGSITRDVFLDASLLPVLKNKDFLEGRGFFLPLGDKLEIKSVYFTIGGNSANAAVTFARQGLKTGCVGNVGDDVGGLEIRKKLESEGIDTSLISVDKKNKTAYSVLLLMGGERTILGYHGASNNFSFPSKTEKLKSRFWYLSLAGDSYKLFPKFISFSAKNKIFVAFNPSGYHIKNAKKDIWNNLHLISFLVLNEEEAAELTGIPFRFEDKVFKKLDKMMPGILAVTNGQRGVTVSDGAFIYKAGTFKEKKLVDRTGAGDAFGSAFLCALIKGGINFANIQKVKPDKIKEAIRKASANATSVVEKLGATEGILSSSALNNPRFKNLEIKIRKISK